MVRIHSPPPSSHIASVTGESSSGRTADSVSVGLGSSPSSPARIPPRTVRSQRAARLFSPQVSSAISCRTLSCHCRSGRPGLDDPLLMTPPQYPKSGSYSSFRQLEREHQTTFQAARRAVRHTQSIRGVSRRSAAAGAPPRMNTSMRASHIARPLPLRIRSRHPATRLANRRQRNASTKKTRLEMSW